MPVYKDPLSLAQNLVDQPGRTPFYYDQKRSNEYNKYLEGFNFGNGDYNGQVKTAIEYLTKKYGLGPGQASDIVDAYVTRRSHLENGPKNSALRKKAGKFETGANWDDAQAAAQTLLQKYPNAAGIVYGLRYRDEQPRGNTGLKTPIVAYDDDLENISRALAGNGSAKFQFDTLYNK